MLFRKRHAVAMLFSINFLLYVVSPLCFTIDGLADRNDSAYQLNHRINNLRVVWELFLSGPDLQNDAGGSRHNVQLLLKKAHALVSTHSIVKCAPSESAEYVFHEIDFTPKSCSSLSRYAIPEHQTGSLPSVSGLSPPFFS